ncbi:hypothetical protein ACYSNW_05575 [Enterococcus sp. LJL99]
MLRLLAALRRECAELNQPADAIKYCYKKIIFDKENTKFYKECLTYFLLKENPNEFLATFKQLRTYSYGRSSWNWLDINVSMFHKTSNDDFPAFWGWLIFHTNGYVREYALQKFISSRPSNCLRFLLLTLNDHLQSLRVQSSNEISKILFSLPKDELIYCFPFIDRLENLEHGENQELHSTISHLLLRQPELLFTAQQNDQSSISRYAFKVSFSLPDEFRLQTLQNGLKSTDKSVLIWTFREIIKEPLWEQTYLDELLHHPASIVRKFTCEWCYNYRPKEKRILACLLDRATVIKRLALKYSKKQFPEIDCRNFYLEHLNDYPVEVFHGLALLQDPEDRVRMLASRQSNRKKIRLSVLLWAKCLPLEEQISLNIDSLADSSRDVRNKATESLIQNYSLFIREKLLSLFKEKQDLSLQLEVLKILNVGNRMDHFFDLIAIYNYGANQQVKSVIELQLNGWYLSWNRRFFFKFSLKQKIELAYIVNKNSSTYSSSLLELLLKIIKTK